MITPALDLQAAPQMADGVRAQSAQPDGSGDSGDFGAAFTASLSSSSSSPTAYTSDKGTTGTQSVNPVNVRNTSDRSATAQKTAVVLSSTATSVRLPIKATALTLLNNGANDSSVDALSEALASVTTETGAALADSSGGKSAAQPLSKSSGPSNAVAADPQLSLKNKDAVVDGKTSSVAAIHVAAVQESLVDASRPLTSDAAETSKTSSLGKGNGSAAKSKVSAHDAQAVTASTAGDVLLASLGTSAPVLTTTSLTTTTTTAPAKEAFVEAVNAPQAQLSLPGQSPGASSTGLSATATAAFQSNLVTAWNSFEIEAPSARNAVTTETASGAAHSGFVHAVGEAGSAFGTGAVPGTSVGLAFADRLPTPPVHWPTSPVATDVAQSSEAVASSGLPTVPAVTGQELRSEALSAGVSSASSVTTTVRPNSIATDTLSSSIPSKPQTASVEPLASRSLSAVGQVRNAATGIFASSNRGTEGAAQSESARAVETTATSASGVQADTKAQPGGDQPRTGATTATASAAAPTTIKQSAVPADRASSSHPSVTAAGTEAVSASHRGSLDDSAATPDRGSGSDAISNVVTGHGDSSVAAVSSHTTATPALDLSNSAITAITNLTATVAHQGSAGTMASSTPAAAGAVGSAAMQVAATDALHGANSLNAAISSQPHQTLAATPTSLEVGVHSGTQGWVKIRAEVGDQGDVTASLAAKSSSGQQILKGQLPALNAYLQSEQMAVTTSVADRIGATHVAVAHDASLGSLSAGTGSAGQDTSLLQSGAGQSAFGQGGGQQGSGSDKNSVVVDSGRREMVQSYASRVESSGSAPTLTAVDGSGRWLNVRV